MKQNLCIPFYKNYANRGVRNLALLKFMQRRSTESKSRHYGRASTAGQPKQVVLEYYVSTYVNSELDME